ncbi:hypothetical protein ILYODFUR_017793 [Ilyodon furcidens]|uniref:Uncharacterized protein n=1 Tax=Ilyodon furcidens TaxID=33524 RepID=A0ABV0SMS0_9TELE
MAVLFAPVLFQAGFLPVCSCIHFSFSSHQICSSAQEKIPHSMMLQPPCFTIEMVCYFVLGGFGMCHTLNFIVYSLVAIMLYVHNPLRHDLIQFTLISKE